MIKVHAKSLEMKHTCIICGLTMIYRTWKNVEDETLNFSNNVQL